MQHDATPSRGGPLRRSRETEPTREAAPRPNASSAGGSREPRGPSIQPGTSRVPTRTTAASRPAAPRVDSGKIKRDSGTPCGSNTSTSGNQTLVPGGSSASRGVAASSRGLTTRSRSIARGSSIKALGPVTVPRGASTVTRGPSTVTRGACTVVHGSSTLARGACTTPRGPSTVTRGRSTLARGSTAVTRGGSPRTRGTLAARGTSLVPRGARVTPRGGGHMARGSNVVPRGPTAARGPRGLSRGPRAVPRGVTVPRGSSLPCGSALSGSIQQALIEKFWIALMVYDTSSSQTTVPGSEGGDETEGASGSSDGDSSESETETTKSESSCDSEVSLGDTAGSWALTNRLDLFSVVADRRRKKRVCFVEEVEEIGRGFLDEEKEDEERKEETEIEEGEGVGKVEERDETEKEGVGKVEERDETKNEEGEGVGKAQEREEVRKIEEREESEKEEREGLLGKVEEWQEGEMKTKGEETNLFGDGAGQNEERETTEQKRSEGTEKKEERDTGVHDREEKQGMGENEAKEIEDERRQDKKQEMANEEIIIINTDLDTNDDIYANKIKDKGRQIEGTSEEDKYKPKEEMREVAIRDRKAKENGQKVKKEKDERIETRETCEREKNGVRDRDDTSGHGCRKSENEVYVNKDVEMNKDGGGGGGGGELNGDGGGGGGGELNGDGGGGGGGGELNGDDGGEDDVNRGGGKGEDGDGGEDENKVEEDEENGGEDGDGEDDEDGVGGVDNKCLEECLKIAILDVVRELPEGWLLVRENIGELVSSVASLVEVQPRLLPALSAALTALLSTHSRHPCDKGSITVLHNAHMLLYVALKLSCTLHCPPHPTHNTNTNNNNNTHKLIIKALQEILTCEGSFDRLMVVVLLGGAAPGRGCGWYYEVEDESEKIRDLTFILDHIRLLPQCRVSEVVSAPLWWCGSSPVVVAALADSPGVLLTLLQYGAGGSHLHHNHYSKCCTNGVYLAITYLLRRLEGQLCQPYQMHSPHDTNTKTHTDLLTLAGHTNTSTCLRYLLRAVPRVPAKLLRDQLLSSDPATLLPRPCCLDPPFLTHLARAATREMLRGRDMLPHVIPSLALPPTLRDYLNLLVD
ncbi:hypothetical protein Pcinc_019633 [Petrolisthes cinctipes]|uniref:SOCS box domain-containing protein n=1 Tax=Petrolisthes cinctipes TaxID=88211 RepID=A0AAE1KHH0_PETCI|nr:hypothetical protein Pcinc_019633 [Petrolisthes cinctipes]